MTLLLALPAAVALAMLSVPLITTLFWHGEFPRNDVIMTRHALIAYAAGLAGIILVKVLAPGFYARQNIRTPVKVAIVDPGRDAAPATRSSCRYLAHAGLALSISAGAVLQRGVALVDHAPQRHCTGPSPAGARSS